MVPKLTLGSEVHSLVPKLLVPNIDCPVWDIDCIIQLVGKGSSKKKREVGKIQFKLESTDRSWKVFNAVLNSQKFSNFFLSNFISNFWTYEFRTSRFFPTTLSNYMYFNGLER